MKRIKQSLLKAASFIGCLSLLLSACTSGEQGMPEPGELRPLEITADIEPQTRAAGTEPGVTATNYDKRAFVTNDRIRVTNSNKAATTADYYYDGTRWLPVNASGSGITTTGGETFTAFYPVSFATIQAIQTSYEAFWKSNKLVASKTAEGNKVIFNFKPAAAKITVVVEYSDATRTGEYVKVSGTAVLTGSSSVSEEITLLKLVNKGTKHTYVGIINPGDSKTYTITVKAESYTAQSYGPVTKKLIAGHNYIYNFSSTNNLILNSVSVVGFNDQPEVSGGDAT